MTELRKGIDTFYNETMETVFWLVALGVWFVLWVARTVEE